jgi:hypothetical protein
MPNRPRRSRRARRSKLCRVGGGGAKLQPPSLFRPATVTNQSDPQNRRIVPSHSKGLSPSPVCIIREFLFEKS